MPKNAPYAFESKSDFGKRKGKGKGKAGLSAVEQGKALRRGKDTPNRDMDQGKGTVRGETFPPPKGGKKKETYVD